MDPFRDTPRPGDRGLQRHRPGHRAPAGRPGGPHLGDRPRGLLHGGPARRPAAPRLPPPGGGRRLPPGGGRGGDRPLRGRPRPLRPAAHLGRHRPPRLLPRDPHRGVRAPHGGELLRHALLHPGGGPLDDGPAPGHHRRHLLLGGADQCLRLHRLRALQVRRARPVRRPAHRDEAARDPRRLHLPLRRGHPAAGRRGALQACGTAPDRRDDQADPSRAGGRRHPAGHRTGARRSSTPTPRPACWPGSPARPPASPAST